MPWYPRIPEERELAEIPAEIRSANTHPMRPNQHLPRTGSRWFVDRDMFKAFGFFEPNGFHRGNVCIKVSDWSVQAPLPLTRAAL